MASGIACRLFQSNFRRIAMLEIPNPLAVRRNVSFSEAVYEETKTVEGVTAVKLHDSEGIYQAWRQGRIPVLLDPDGSFIKQFQPDVVVDAILAKKNTGTHLQDAKLVIALGPGFEGGKDAHFVIETSRGHNLGRLISSGKTEPNTGIPGSIGDFTTERVLRSEEHGIFETDRKIGNKVVKGDIIGNIGKSTVKAEIDGILRGLIRPGTEVTKSLKIGDIDPRGNPEYCYTVSEKARAIGGAVLEAILQVYNK